jgi:hypothetical protein
MNIEYRLKVRKSTLNYEKLIFVFRNFSGYKITLIPFAVGKWMVKKDNTTCLIVEMDIGVNFTYTTVGENQEIH